MGGEQRNAGKHLCLYAAGLLLIVQACSHDPAFRERMTGRWEHLAPVENLLGEGDFEGAMRTYQAMLARPRSARQADLILFDQALLSAHYANPRKDYGRSRALLTRLLREHPRSPLAEEARIWMGVLETMESSQRVDIELEEKQRASHR